MGFAQFFFFQPQLLRQLPGGGQGVLPRGEVQLQPGRLSGGQPQAAAASDLVQMQYFNLKKLYHLLRLPSSQRTGK